MANKIHESGSDEVSNQLVDQTLTKGTEASEEISQAHHDSQYNMLKCRMYSYIMIDAMYEYK